MAKVLIIYSTVGGNTEIAVERVFEVIKKKKIDAQIFRVEKIDLKTIDKYENIVLAAPTYGHGDFDKNFKIFFKEFLKLKLSNKNFAIISLGDSKYEPFYMFNSAKLIEEGLKTTKQVDEMSFLLPALKINKSPVAYLDNRIEDWAKQLAQEVNKKS